MKKDQYRDQISHDPENESDVDMESIVDESFDQIHDLSSNHTTTAHLPLLKFNDNDDYDQYSPDEDDNVFMNREKSFEDDNSGPIYRDAPVTTSEAVIRTMTLLLEIII